MSQTSSIEWTDATWNPVTGCDRVSPGCAHCYALDLAARLKGMGQARYQKDGDPKTSGPGFGLTLHPDKLNEPLRWRKPRMVFVNSMSDLFHEEVPDEYIGRVFGVMIQAERHTFQVLTKRPERMKAVLSQRYEDERSGFWRGFLSQLPSSEAEGLKTLVWPVPNVWLGVSIENRRFVHRADLLRETPAAVRFISAEPLLGPLVGWRATSGSEKGNSRCVRCERVYLRQHVHRLREGWVCGNCSKGKGLPVGEDWGRELDLTGVDWLIVGGESGPKARRMDPQWVRDLRDAAAHAGAAFFVKQMGGRRPGDKLEDLPEDLRIREFPEVLSAATG